jgi:hypothetical protein
MTGCPHRIAPRQQTIIYLVKTAPEFSTRQLRTKPASGSDMTTVYTACGGTM